MYLVNTRPNMCYIVNHLSQDMVRPTKLFRMTVKHVLRYLIGTTQFGLWYRQTKGVKLCSFTNVVWVGIPSNRKITSGGIFSVRSTAISWYNRKKRFVALNSPEAEYMVVSQVACEMIQMRKILVELFGQMMNPIVIYRDNESCINLSENLVFS